MSVEGSLGTASDPLVPSWLRRCLSGRIGWYLREWVEAVAHSTLHLAPLCGCICRKVATSSNQLGQTAAELRAGVEAAVPYHRHLWRSDAVWIGVYSRRPSPNSCQLCSNKTPDMFLSEKERERESKKIIQGKPEIWYTCSMKQTKRSTRISSGLPTTLIIASHSLALINPSPHACTSERPAVTISVLQSSVSQTCNLVEIHEQCNYNPGTHF